MIANVRNTGRYLLLLRVTASSVTREGEEDLREDLERSLDVLDEITAVEARDESRYSVDGTSGPSSKGLNSRKLFSG